MLLKKEIKYILFFLVIVLIGVGFMFKPEEKEEIDKENKIVSPIIIQIDGEVVRRTKLVYSTPLTYGKLLLQIQTITNEYSDLSGFSLDERITQSVNITIPTKDINNQYQENKKIYINYATEEELKMLPQIGDKRSQKILEYREEYGRISTWEQLWKIVSVSDEAKKKIIQQAIL